MATSRAFIFQGLLAHMCICILFMGRRSKASSSRCAYYIHIHALAISIFFSWGWWEEPPDEVKRDTWITETRSAQLHLHAVLTDETHTNAARKIELCKPVQTVSYFLSRRPDKTIFWNQIRAFASPLFFYFYREQRGPRPQKSHLAKLTSDPFHFAMTAIIQQKIRNVMLLSGPAAGGVVYKDKRTGCRRAATGLALSLGFVLSTWCSYS